MNLPNHIASMPFVTARREDDCEPATCTNGKCNATGECIETVAREMRVLGESFPRGKSPPLVPLPPDVRDAICKWPKGASRENACGWPTCRCAWNASTELPPLGDSRRHASHTPRTIVAFTGLAGSGKSTAAAHLVHCHGFQRVRFAGPLKAMLAALGLTSEQIDGSEKETPCDLLGGKTPRYAMQTIGTEWGRDLIASDLWIRAWKAAVAKVPAGVPVVVDDCRFPNEAEAVRAAGGVIVRIDRPGAGAGAAGHVSEQHQIEAATTICNDTSIAGKYGLQYQIDRLIRDLSWAAAS